MTGNVRRTHPAVHQVLGSTILEAPINCDSELILNTLIDSGPDAVGVRPLCLCQIRSGYLYSFQSYKGGPNISNLGHVTLSHAHFGVIL